MSQPSLQAEALWSIAKATTAVCKLPIKQTKKVREMGAEYFLIVVDCHSSHGGVIFMSVNISWKSIKNTEMEKEN